MRHLFSEIHCSHLANQAAYGWFFTASTLISTLISLPTVVPVESNETL
jgi:hypothetical protein